MRIEVEPQELISAGEQIGALGFQLGMLSDAMGQALASGIASGNDAAGINFGVTYGRHADVFASQLGDAADAFTNVGRMLEATGYNYRNADAASVAGGPGPSGGASGVPRKTQPGDAPYGPSGATVPPPTSWHLIQPLLNVIPGFGFFAGTAMTWPNGDAALLNVTAAQWRNIARGLSLFEPAMTSAKALAGAQNIPEGTDITKALADLGLGVTTLSTFAGEMATAITGFATGVQETQDAIRRLLDRVSLEGLWDTVTGFLTGEGDDILREVARDVSTVLENFQNQVKGLVGLLEELGLLLHEAADTFQKWMRPALVGAFGEQHGNILAAAVTWYTDVQVGSVAALVGTVADTVALADPDTWKGMADMAVSIAKDPSKVDDVLLDMGREFIALDQMQGDHPGRGIGAAGFNIASLFTPGGALSKTGTVAKGLSATRGLFRHGLPGSPGRLRGLDSATTDMPDPPDAPAAPDIPEFDSPGVPESVLGPNNPGVPPGSTATPPATPGSGRGAAPTGPLPSNGAEPSQPGSAPVGSGAGPADPSPGGPAPLGGAPSAGGGDGTGAQPVSGATSSPPDADSVGLQDGRTHDSGDSPSPAVSPVDSNDETDDGWHRIDDKPGDPTYGQPLDDHWDSGDYPTPSPATQPTFDLIERPDEPYGHDSEGHPLSKDEYDARYNLVGPEGQKWANYPPNDGAVPGSRVLYDSVDAFLRDHGPHLDRIGEDSGSYLSVMPDGNPPSFESRGLPISSLNHPYDRFSLTSLPEDWSIEVSRIAPAFGRDGGALQVLVYNDEGMKMSVKQLIRDGVLE